VGAAGPSRASRRYQGRLRRGRGVRSTPSTSAVTLAALLPRSRERALAGTGPMRVATALPVDVVRPAGPGL
jgi:hypothetical protein